MTWLSHVISCICGAFVKVCALLATLDCIYSRLHSSSVSVWLSCPESKHVFECGVRFENVVWRRSFRASEMLRQLFFPPFLSVWCCSIFIFSQRSRLTWQIPGSGICRFEVLSWRACVAFLFLRSKWEYSQPHVEDFWWWPVWVPVGGVNQKQILICRCRFLVNFSVQASIWSNVFKNKEKEGRPLRIISPKQMFWQCRLISNSEVFTKQQTSEMFNWERIFIK